MAENQQGITFESLVQGYATAATSTLQAVENLLSAPPEQQDRDSEQTPPSDQAAQALAGVRQLIDILEVLKAKTEGNLTEGEAELLSQTLTELKFHCVQVTERVKREGN